MTEETGQYQAEFVGKAQGVAIGEGNVIYNYFYYSQEAKPADTNSDDGADLPCPYRGLFHFGPNDAEFFFGRDIFVAELYSATQTRCFIPVLGASGSGKSSVVLAGLVPKLQQLGRWQFTHFRPGADPFHALALALVPLYATTLNETERIAQSRQLATYLRQGDVPLGDVFAQIQQNFPQERILLIADQFEELYTLCPEAETRHRFLDQIIAEFQSSTAKPGRAVLVLTMRADFLGSALSYPAFADQLRSVDIKIRSMNREELAEVIEKPAAKLGVTFEGGLVERILNDVADQPGNLPLLEFALTELWHQRTGKQLTHEVYEAIGQVEGALARHADQKYENLSEAEKAQVRRIFVQLVRPGEGAEDTRRIAMKSEIGEQSWSLVKQLADARLVVTSCNATEQETVEVVHEALIRNWGELRGWMETDRVFRAWQERLRAAMRQWEETNRDTGSLLRGAALAEAEERLAERPDDLVAEREFIQQSIKDRDNIKQQQERLRKRIFVGLGVGLVSALSLSGIAVWQWRQAAIAKGEVMARSAELLFQQGEDFEALLESLRAGMIIRRLRAEPSRKLMNQLQRAAFTVRERNTLFGHDNFVTEVIVSPKGDIFASASTDKTIKIWNLSKGQEILTLSGHTDNVNSVSFSPDGKKIASASDDQTIKIWDIGSGQELYSVSGHDDGISTIRFSPDGNVLASASWDKTIRIWDSLTGKELRTLSGHNEGVNSISFSPDGNVLASASWDKTIRIWNTSTWQEIKTLSGHTSSIGSVEFSPDNKFLASAGKDETIKIWDSLTGKELRTFSGHRDSIVSIKFSPNSKTLASGGWDNQIKIWDIVTGKELFNISGNIRNINSLSFSSDGKSLITGHGDLSIKVWSLKTGEESRTLFNHRGSFHEIYFNSGNQISASVIDKQSISIRDVITDTQLQSITLSKQHDTFSSKLSNYIVAISPNKKILASVSRYQPIEIWDMTIGQVTQTLSRQDDEHKAITSAISFSPDSKMLASASRNDTVQIWDVVTGQAAQLLTGHRDDVRSVAFSPDGKTLASSSADKTTRLWDINTGEEIQTFLGDDSSIDEIRFSPDGHILATAGRSNRITLWNIETGTKLFTLSGHDADVWEVSFSPDGKLLASGSADKTIKLWDVKTGEELRTLFGHNGGVYVLSFSLDGKMLASAGADGKLMLWELDLWNVSFTDLLERGCNQVKDYLANPNAEFSEDDRHLCDGIGTEQE